MKTILHKASDRGHANHGWLDSWHSFSFAGYHNPDKIHFGVLRVLNDDIVLGGYGFPPHPHANMEIISIPLSGDLEHKDSTGRHAIIRSNDVQIMSAGSGIQHSEMNANADKPVNFLQIWVFPKQEGIEPRYEQKTYLPGQRVNKLQTVVAPDDSSAVWINQDAWFSLGNFDGGYTQHYQVKKEGNGVYLFVIDGSVQVNGQQLNKRDALGIWDTDSFTITAGAKAEILLMDVPMQLPA
ncbi:pirin family protein [Deminuibacter soli]|uniref:Pirin family protein n=1 Tax=Deminuibacter soli TaxID=2291815 RepID=A0A3E1NQA2_9BACT|nr:pirin family protein [Deminuibacter soli]RFM29994.1 pirin family protein [Deminuibacter soli]